MSDPLELELQIVVNHHVGAGKKAGVLCKSNKCCLTIEAISLAPGTLLLKEGNLVFFSF